MKKGGCQNLGIDTEHERKLFINFASSLLILALLLTTPRAQSQSASRYPAGSGYPAPTLTLFSE
jgi:hypothetical protein